VGTVAGKKKTDSKGANVGYEAELWRMAAVECK